MHMPSCCFFLYNNTSSATGIETCWKLCKDKNCFDFFRLLLDFFHLLEMSHVARDTLFE